MTDAPQQRIAFLDGLRAIACLLVVYAHLIGYRAPANWIPRYYIENYLVAPFGIIWHFGFIGVAIFFVISGYIITHVSQTEQRASFFVKRMFRIYPPAIVAVLAGIAAAHVMGTPAAQFDLRGAVSEASLFWSDFVANAPTYTLVIELMFYAVVLAILPLMKSRPLAAMAIVILVPVLIQLLAWQVPVGEKATRLIGYTGFLSVFATGMALYYLKVGRIRGGAAAAVIVAAVIVLIWRTGATPTARGFQSNTVWAIVIFSGALMVSDRYNPNRVMNAIGLASYSIYLLHVPIGVLTPYLLTAKIGYNAAICVALLAVAAASALQFFLIERPSQSFARRLLQRRRRMVEAIA